MEWALHGSLLGVQEPPLQCEEGPGLWLQWLRSLLEASPLPAQGFQDLGRGRLACELAHRLFSVEEGRGGQWLGIGLPMVG